jgi:FixJ family two-component response regulator
MTGERSTVFVIDDDASVRRALQNLLRSVGLEAKAFSDADEFLVSDGNEAPGCIVLDVRLPGLSGIELQRHLIERSNHRPIVFISGHADVRMSVQAMKAGAVEFLTKPFRDQELLDAVQQAIAWDRRARAQRAEAAEVRRRYESLSPREREVMDLVVRGLLNKQIAAEVSASEATVKQHRAQVMKKMRADSVADLVRLVEKLERPAEK